MKILIIRLSSIGDIVLTTPVIRCLKLQTNCELHFLTKKSFQGIVATNPYISKVHTIEKQVKEILPVLQQENFDYVIDLHKNWRSWRIKLGLRKKNFTFRKLNWEKWLMVNLKINRLPNIHIVNRYLATVDSLGVKNDEKGLDYFIPEKDVVNIADFFANHGFLSTPPYLAFVIGAAHATKRLPTPKIIDICDLISVPILLIGGPNDAVEAVSVISKSKALVISTCGQYNLNQSASLVKQAAVVVSNDTGMMHIAAAFQKEIISIWGNTIPDFGMYPYFADNIQSNVSVEVANLECRPCSKIGFSSCPKKHFKCMNLIASETVAKVIEQKLNQ